MIEDGVIARIKTECGEVLYDTNSVASVMHQSLQQLPGMREQCQELLQNRFGTKHNTWLSDFVFNVKIPATEDYVFRTLRVMEEIWKEVLSSVVMPPVLPDGTYERIALRIYNEKDNRMA
jgi:hypothetical protein